MKWKEKLYTFIEKKDIDTEGILRALQFPELIELHFNQFLNKFNYIKEDVDVFEGGSFIHLTINFINFETKRRLSFSIIPDFPDPIILVRLIQDYTAHDQKRMILNDFLVPKSNGKISYNNFNLNHYIGTWDDRIRQFAGFLEQQLKIRGSHFIAGTGWSDNYEVSW